MDLLYITGVGRQVAAMLREPAGKSQLITERNAGARGREGSAAPGCLQRVSRWRRHFLHSLIVKVEQHRYEARGILFV
jgi:hypothetical protein